MERREGSKGKEERENGSGILRPVVCRPLRLVTSLYVLSWCVSTIGKALIHCLEFLLVNLDWLEDKLRQFKGKKDEKGDK